LPSFSWAAKRRPRVFPKTIHGLASNRRRNKAVMGDEFNPNPEISQLETDHSSRITRHCSRCSPITDHDSLITIH
jgi:hypothetical protein